MGSIAVIQSRVNFMRSTPICGNCQSEKREHDESRNRTERSCSKHGFFVLMSATCTDHKYRQKGEPYATPKR
jgi:hypothetical protein